MSILCLQLVGRESFRGAIPEGPRSAYSLVSSCLGNESGDSGASDTPRATLAQSLAARLEYLACRIGAAYVEKLRLVIASACSAIGN